ncbi:hypothetical protein R1flu_007477 [Riccia fluitans]|uniref:Nucleoporin Nup43 n=1 Tax=Riccia fluitans TaxID=41844 RepID=A0ABD1YZ59_9MARC
MAEVEVESWRIAENRYVDAVRWLPSVSPYHAPFMAVGLWDSDRKKTVLELCSIEQDEPSSAPTTEVHHSFFLPSRVTEMKTSLLTSGKSMVVASSRTGDISVLLVSEIVGAQSSPSPVICAALHKGEVSGLDLESSSQDCVTVGEDGKINVVKVTQSQLQPKILFDNNGLMSFSAVRWASSAEFVTGSLGSTLQWWDQRRPGGAVSQSPAKWANFTGGVNCIDVHPSRKHLCVIGGSEGYVYAWDLRWQQAPIPLNGHAMQNGRGHLLGDSLVESEVWEVKYDPLLQLAGHMTESGKIPPVMMCSEDGILAVLDSGETLELLSEPMAINTFDIHPESSSKVICGLEFQGFAYLRRST